MSSQKKTKQELLTYNSNSHLTSFDCEHFFSYFIFTHLWIENKILQKLIWNFRYQTWNRHSISLRSIVESHIVVLILCFGDWTKWGRTNWHKKSLNIARHEKFCIRKKAKTYDSKFDLPDTEPKPHFVRLSKIIILKFVLLNLLYGFRNRQTMKPISGPTAFERQKLKWQKYMISDDRKRAKRLESGFMSYNSKIKAKVLVYLIRKWNFKFTLSIFYFHLRDFLTNPSKHFCYFHLSNERNAVKGGVQKNSLEPRHVGIWCIKFETNKR